MATKKKTGKAGRPTKYDPAYCQQIIDHMQDGASIASFAAEIGVARSSINKWAEEHEAFSEALKVAKAKCAAWWERQLRQIAIAGGGPGAATAVIFGLKNMASDDWRDRQEHDLTSSDGSMTPKPALDPSKLSTAALAEIMAAADEAPDKG